MKGPGANKGKALWASGFQVTAVTAAMLAASVLTSTTLPSPSSSFGTAGLPDSTPKAVQLLGSSLYTLTGAANIYLLLRDERLAPSMVYTNAVMCWSAFLFGFIQVYTDNPPRKWLLQFDEWYTMPNFAWGVEWGFQLLEATGTADVVGPIELGNTPSGFRALAILALSIASYGLKLLLPPPATPTSSGGSGDNFHVDGFVLALLPQVVAAIAMCIYCVRRYGNSSARKYLAAFLLACVAFLVLHAVDDMLPRTIISMPWYHPLKHLCIKISDCTQIHFSIRFFVAMFWEKGAEKKTA